jgi:hypothetical protein
MISLEKSKNHRYRPGNMKITSDLTNLTTPILILTVQMFLNLNHAKSDVAIGELLI